ncbi:HAMP domain-containing sensor histidine kinase [Pseudoalteromonas sp. BZB3]|uniref:sensor histidine kinase n=1 Tax=Pseudoalteromonas sp. BZB3 TaxID=3136670 RepID=UPI0032C43AA4
MRVQSSLLIFKVASSTCVFLIMLASWLMYSHIAHTQRVELQLNRLKLAAARLVGVKNDYIQERQPEFIESFDKHYFQFEKEYGELAQLLLDEPKVMLQLSAIESNTALLRQTLKRFEQFQIKLGHEADEGVYGLFRSHAHQLQSYVQTAEQPMLELEVLELRRAEKDFLLRHDHAYIERHTGIYEKLYQKLQSENPQAALLLKAYRQGFLSYSAVLTEIGFNSKQGLRKQLDEQKNALTTKILGLSNSIILQDHDTKQAWVLSLLGTIILICSVCFVLLMILHARVSKKINVINDVLDKVVEHENFKLRTNLNNTDELGQIGTHVDKLLEYLDSLLVRLSSAQKRLLEGAEVASFSNIIHRFTQELNTPLGEVKSGKGDMAELIAIMKSNLRDGLDENASITEMISHLESTLDIIESNLTVSEQLVEEFKLISANQHLDVLTYFNLLDQVEHAFRINDGLLPAGEYDITFDISEELFINSYPSAINQIINLCIHNSIKHGKIANQKLHIVVSAMVVNDFVHIYFKDDGMGIDKEILPVIFEPFITSKRHSGGTGLGMSIIHNLVTQKLKGEVKMQSPAHGGACLHIILSETEFSQKQLSDVGTEEMD